MPMRICLCDNVIFRRQSIKQMTFTADHGPDESESLSDHTTFVCIRSDEKFLIKTHLIIMTESVTLYRHDMPELSFLV